MGFFKKIIGAVAVAVVAAVGGALYVKNKKDENEGVLKILMMKKSFR
ncbi:MAG: hypothetical protein ACLUR5_14560 [Eubacterium ventriosum]